MYTNSSGAQSRTSSLAEDNESYVPMHPIAQIPDDYLNMQPAASATSSQASTRGGDLSSATSSCSITSGTPSTDIRFSEYHLDKVQARFTPSEDDDIMERQPRTYSVGSKLEHSKRRLPIDRVVAENINSRHRAYSVGSRVKVTRADLMSHSGTHTPSHNSPTSINHHEINNNSSSKNKKSSSAPHLINNLLKTSHGSFDHMDDLMEIDYSRGSNESTSSNLNNIGNTPVKSSPVNIPCKSSDEYMNMLQSKPSPQNVSDYIDMRSGSRIISENENYLEMIPKRNPQSLSSSPLKTSSVSRTAPLPASSSSIQSEMTPRSYEGLSNTRKNRSNTSFASTNVASEDYLNMSPVNKSLLEVVMTRSSVPEGYIEMSWNKNNKNRSIPTEKDIENPSSSSDEYINMDYSNNNECVGTSDSNASTSDRLISLPITIQKRQSCSSRPTKSSEKTENEGGQQVHLPLINPMTASISPTRNRTRCDSRDSGIVTPSSGSQATIFPFSPFNTSPTKQFTTVEDQNRKCLMDGTTGTVTLSDENTIEEEPRTPVPVGVTMQGEKFVEHLSSDITASYAVMNLGEPKPKKPNLSANPIKIKSPMSTVRNFSSDTDSESHDYINCTPTLLSNCIFTPKPFTPTTVSREPRDYALMNPIKKTISPLPISDAPPQTASKKSLLLTLSSQEKLNSNSCFKPIVEDDSVKHNHHLRQTTERNARISADSGYEILVRPTLSRPNSVNSDKIKNAFLSNRPNSALSASSSTSTLCEIRSASSSSQAIRLMDTSAVPSPMSGTSRPESVSSDIQMTSRPPSVTSERERELHYASLDLPPCSNMNSYVSRMEVDQKMDLTTSPSPQLNSASSSSSTSSQSQPAFTYAQIDFQKSDTSSLKAQQEQIQSGSKK
jgi:insulin receptor substrate 1